MRIPGPLVVNQPAKNKVTNSADENGAARRGGFNYFNYFTEIEEYFWKKRGAHLLVSPLDWAILETWQKAGIPLRAVQKGIDRAFEAYARSKRKRPIKSLAYCVDAVLDAAREMSEAAVGKMPQPAISDPSSSLRASQRPDTGLSAERIARFLEQNATLLRSAAGKTKLDAEALQPATAGQRPTTREEPGHRPPATGHRALGTAFEHAANELLAIASQLPATVTSTTGRPEPPQEEPPIDLEDLERRLTILEEKLVAVITANLDEEELLEIRREMDRALVPYRRKMTADQLALLERQYTQRKLFERFRLPRLSLFYLG